MTVFRGALEGFVSITHISTSETHCLACDSAGRCYGWGSNVYGQLGLDLQDAFIKQPTLNTTLIDSRVVMTACGQSHSIFLTAVGQVYGAGLNDLGQLGLQYDFC